MNALQQSADTAFIEATKASSRLRLMVQALREQMQSVAPINRGHAFTPSIAPDYGSISLRVPTPGIPPDELSIHIHFAQPGELTVSKEPYERQMTVLAGEIEVAGRRLHRGDTHFWPANTPMMGTVLAPAVTVTVERPGIPYKPVQGYGESRPFNADK